MAEDLKNLLANEAFQAYVKYGTIVVVKMFLMSPITVFFRLRKKIFTTKEDYAAFARGMHNAEVRVKLATKDPTIERIRRCHLNDLENIPPFLFVGLFYALTTNPTPSTALLHFQIFAASRIIHTISYLLHIPQPVRFLAFLTGWLTTGSMALRVLIRYL